MGLEIPALNFFGENLKYMDVGYSISIATWDGKNYTSKEEKLMHLDYKNASLPLPGNKMFITLYKDNLDTEFGLSYSADRNDSQYKKLFEQHKHMLLIEKPEQFLITNLERVTCDETFANNIVKSYLSKDEFNTEISSICNLILWKNKNGIINSFFLYLNLSSGL
jgi:hypothetical protein